MDVFYLKGSHGPLLSIHHPAVRKRHPRLGLVYSPPFAEEMNRGRRMAALQARRLADLGVDVLLLDPFGTGDSAGEFGAASLEIWRNDLATAIDWLGTRTDCKVGLWGVRLGALLAADVAAADPSRIACLVFWQPVLSGERHLTQFLRLRLAATIHRGPARESTKDLRARLSQGQSLEVAGYELAPALAHGIAALQLENIIPRLTSVPISWLEVTSEEQAALSPDSSRMVGALAREGRRIVAKAVSGGPFWGAQEITLAPNLLQATDDLFRT